MLGNLKVEKTVNGESQGVSAFVGPHKNLCAYSVDLPAVTVWHVWALTDTMDYQCIIVYTIITILPPNRPGLAADTQWEPQGTAARACCFAWIKCCIKRCAVCVLWVQSSLVNLVVLVSWNMDLHTELFLHRFLVRSIYQSYIHHIHVVMARLFMFPRKAAIRGYYFELSEDFPAKILAIQSKAEMQVHRRRLKFSQ